MDKVLLWAFLFIGIGLLLYSLRKLPFNEWILLYLLTAYLAIVIGVFVVEENMLEYPVKFLGNHFKSSLLFEYLWLPLINIYFYRTTYHSSYSGILFQGFVYTSVITIVELILERYTNVIQYYTWTWLHTFIGIWIFFVVIRIVMKVFLRTAPENTRNH